MNSKETNPSLELSTQEMKTLGYAVIDILVEHFSNLKNKRVGNVAKRVDLEKIFREPVPESGMNPEVLLDFFKNKVITNTSCVDHPRFFAFVPSPGNYISTMADALISGINFFSGNWLESSAASQIELVTIDWLKELCGLPKSSGGLFVSGGSMANLTALIVARNIKLKNNIQNAVVYFSDQTHSSIEKGFKILGFEDLQIKKIKSDSNFRLPIGEFKKTVEQDKANGKKPFCVIVNAGTTNTGAVDPIWEISEYCKKENLWLHADGAYGAAVVLTPQGKEILKGLELVDSLSLDPHKWLFQPFEIGCVLIKDAKWMKEMFHASADYLKDAEIGTNELNFFDYGIQMTRSFRALKLWMSLKVFGLNSFREAIAHGFKMAELVEKTVLSSSKLKLVTKANLGVVTFRYEDKKLSDEKLNFLNKQIVEEIIKDGFAMISSTALNGQVVLRMCPINPRTQEIDITDTIQKIEKAGNDIINKQFLVTT